MLICPSDAQWTRLGPLPGLHGWCSDASNGDPSGCSSGGGTWGTNYWFGAAPELGLTNYLPSGGAIGGHLENGFERYKGVFGGGEKTRFKDVVDGTSNTVAFWEVTGGDDYSFAWIDNGAFPTAWGFGDGYYQLNSSHTGGTQCLLADGSVRFVSENINADWINGVLHSIASMKEGNPVGEY